MSGKANTPIPPGFVITFCEAGEARGIEPNYCKFSGTAARGGKSAHDVAGLIFRAIENQTKPKAEKKKKKPVAGKKKSHKQTLRERAEALFTS
jgi:hypothetical protein